MDKENEKKSRHRRNHRHFHKKNKSFNKEHKQSAEKTEGAKAEEVAEEVIMNAPTIPARPVIAVDSVRRFTQISSAPESPAIIGEQPASIGSEMKKTSSRWEEYKTIQAGLKR